jgi:hypothetical protein
MDVEARNTQVAARIRGILEQAGVPLNAYSGPMPALQLFENWATAEMNGNGDAAVEWLLGTGSPPPELQGTSALKKSDMLNRLESVLNSGLEAKRYKPSQPPAGPERRSAAATTRAPSAPRASSVPRQKSPPRAPSARPSAENAKDLEYIGRALKGLTAAEVQKLVKIAKSQRLGRDFPDSYFHPGSAWLQESSAGQAEIVERKDFVRQCVATLRYSSALTQECIGCSAASQFACQCGMRYCSDACAVRDWDTHQLECK